MMRKVVLIIFILLLPVSGFAIEEKMINTKQGQTEVNVLRMIPGKNQIVCQYDSETSVTIIGTPWRVCHIDDGNSSKLYWLKSDIDLEITGSDTDKIYIWVSVPTDGSLNLSASDFGFTTTMPTLNRLRGGWYTSDDKRVIGYCYLDGADTIEGFHISADGYWSLLSHHRIRNSIQTTGETTYDLWCGAFPGAVVLFVAIVRSGGQAIILYGKGAEDISKGISYMFSKSSPYWYMVGESDLAVDDNRQITLWQSTGSGEYTWCEEVGFQLGRFLFYP